MATTAPTIKTVHVVYKTHLDLGFTDYAANVINKYVDDYIPGAMALARELAAEGSDDGFIWTTGSWLIRHFLDNAPAAGRADMVAAIKAGHIRWHGLPCSTQTELMDKTLSEYAMSISQRLDAEFGLSTVAAKMTDVPGHTLGLVPLMAQAGLQYLHIGVNPSSALPDVPAAFVWRAPDGSEIVVNYDADYGAVKPGQAYTVPGLEDALYVAHTGDNLGPPTAESVHALFALLRENYPDAQIKASTLDDFARVLWDSRDTLPVVTEEIGDSWIHGVASDPILVSRMRALMSLRDIWLADGRLQLDSSEYRAFSDNLLLVAEHTWGGDLKKFLPDFKNFSKADFQAARLRDVIEPGLIPEIHRAEAPGTIRSYSAFEKTWADKRGYSDAAVAALPKALQDEAQQVLDSFVPAATTPTSAGNPLVDNQQLGQFTASFGADGSITSLIGADGKIWADSENLIGAYSYQTFGNLDYQRWYGEYCRDLSVHKSWAVADFGKVGFEFITPTPRNEFFRPRVTNTTLTSTDAADIVTIHAVLPERACADSGAPRNLEIRYSFAKDAPTLEIELKSLNKDASRLPEASWFTLAPKVNNPNLWTMDKLGLDVSPLNVVRNGNRNMHAINTGIHYAGADGTATITSVDAPVVGIGSPRLMQFDNSFADLSGGFHVNLYNNVWGTNFTMWTDEDMLHRFTLELK